MNYKISTKEKKSIEGRDIWCKDGKKIYVSTRFRSGYVVIDEKPTIPEFDHSIGLAISELGEIQTHSLDDGAYVEQIIPDNFTKKQKEKIEGAWDTNGEDGLSDLGWSLDDFDVVIYGPVTVETYEE